MVRGGRGVQNLVVEKAAFERIASHCCVCSAMGLLNFMCTSAVQCLHNKNQKKKPYYKVYKSRIVNKQLDQLVTLTRNDIATGHESSPAGRRSGCSASGPAGWIYKPYIKSLGLPKPAGPHPETRLAGYNGPTFPSNVATAHTRLNCARRRHRAMHVKGKVGPYSAIRLISGQPRLGTRPGGFGETQAPTPTKYCRVSPPSIARAAPRRAARASAL
jgi:hypothetical protein